MIDGSPYQRLLAVNGKPLSNAQAAEEIKKQEKEVAARRAQTAEQRNKRIAEYEKERNRDHVMMAQLTKAFDFKLAGARQVKKRTVWVLTATARRDYRPISAKIRKLP